MPTKTAVAAPSEDPDPKQRLYYLLLFRLMLLEALWRKLSQ